MLSPIEQIKAEASRLDGLRENLKRLSFTPDVESELESLLKLRDAHRALELRVQATEATIAKLQEIVGNGAASGSD